MPLFDARRVLVVVAHPDDEVLGCGGTVARLTSGGAEVTALILATGAMSRAQATLSDIAHLRRAAEAAAAELGVQPTVFRDFPDNRMDTVPLLDVIADIEAVVADLRPQLILTHAGGDLNVDHRVTRAAVLTACRPLPGSSVTTVLAFETVSSTEWGDDTANPFRPTLYVDIDATLERKQKALRCYQSEMRESPHPRSFEQIADLARVRGRQAGLKAAEAFEVVRSVVKAA